MKTKTLFFASLFLFASTLSVHAQSGADLFRANCAACHSIGRGIVSGPDLKGATSRHAEKWLMKWIKSSSAMIQDGDKTAVALYEKFNQISMPDQELSDAQIKDIIAYIKSQSPTPEVTGVTKKNEKTANDQPEMLSSNQGQVVSTTPVVQNNPQTVKDITRVQGAQAAAQGSGALRYFLVGLIALLVLIIYMMGYVIKSLSGALANSYHAGTERSERK